jgi:hypothetical protein
MEPEVTSGADSSLVVKLTLDAMTAEKLLLKKPRSLPTATFCALLIEELLDRSATLAERPEGSEASSSSLNSNSNVSLKKEFKNNQSIKAANSKKNRVRPAYDDAFTAFWNEYQRAPLKANAQSKKKAFEAWGDAVKQETPERLLQAAQKAVEEVKAATTLNEWCAPLPDCFRWLRDERYAVLLENHTPAGPQMIGGYVVYD